MLLLFVSCFCLQLTQNDAIVNRSKDDTDCFNSHTVIPLNKRAVFLTWNCLLNLRLDRVRNLDFLSLSLLTVGFFRSHGILAGLF